MLIKAEQKFARTSPRKLRHVADSVRGVGSPQQVLDYLAQTPQRAGVVLAKVVKQALGNAKNNFGLNEEGLKIKEMVIGEGPTYKRGQPVSRGRFHPIMKRTSHIRIILESEDKPKSDVKQTKKEGAAVRRPASVAGRKTVGK